MPIFGINATGRTWPTELEVSRLDAPSQEYILDPTLPTLGTDPKFESDKVVIGRGRLVGVKADASGHTTSNITTGVAHKSILTVADGVSIRPLGYAKNNISKDWAQRPGGVMPDINRNMLIAVPYINTVNGAHGVLKQGDPVTAYNSSDPRFKGAIVKFIPKGVYEVTGVDADGVSTGCPDTLTQPIVVGNATGFSFAKAGGFWTVAHATETSVLLSFGHAIHMKAGDVWGMEGLDDMPGFMKWVETNYGAWMLPPTFMPLGNSKARATYSVILNAGGYVELSSNGTDVVADKKIDASQSIVIKVKATAIYAWNDAVGAYEQLAVGATLPKATFDTADQTTGRNYMVDPINGRITLFGLASDANGTPLTEAEIEARIEVSAVLEAMKYEPAYGSGIYGFGDGDSAHAGTPLSYLKDPVTGASSIGVMRVAIL